MAELQKVRFNDPRLSMMVALQAGIALCARLGLQALNHNAVKEEIELTRNIHRSIPVIFSSYPTADALLNAVCLASVGQAVKIFKNADRNAALKAMGLPDELSEQKVDRDYVSSMNNKDCIRVAAMVMMAPGSTPETKRAMKKAAAEDGFLSWLSAEAMEINYG